MAQNYTRQSSFADGDTITAALFNNEFNQVVNAFSYSASSDSSTGHKHDGTAGQGGNIPQIGDIDFLNKIVVDNTNNRWGFYVQVSSGTVEQLRIQDGAIVPVTDDDIDLGTSSLEFKDLFLDGTAHIDTLDVDVNATVAGTLGVTGATTLSSTLGVTGATTLSSTLGVTGAITGSSTLQATTITATTAFVPDASDGASLGTSALEFSDLFLADGAVINFGTDQDVSLTHVADTGLLLNSTMALQFNDASQYINAPSATVLDINATDEIELNATLVDVNANLDVSGTVTATGTSVFASLDISGDIDVDGTTNLDVVDIDGAVNIAAATTIATDNKIQFRDTAIYVNSSTDGQLDIVADTEVQIAATTVDINGAVDISGNLDVGGNLVVTGTTTFNGGTLTMGDAATDNVVFGADINSNIIPNTDDTYDLGSSSQEWRNLYIDGTANIDSLVADTADINGGTIDGVTIGGSSAGDITYANLSDGTITITAFADEDDMSSDSATLVPTQQSVKAYVDSQVTAQDLDIVGDTGTDSIDLDSETITFTGGTGITSVVTTGTVTHNIDSTVATLTGSQTLTNKSLTAPTLTGTAIVASLDISGDIDVDGTANLDVVDIDGAVDMASTLAVGGVLTANAGVVVDTMTLDAATLTATGDFTVDAVGDIILDADTGVWRFKDAGTTLYQIAVDGASVVLYTGVSDADMVFKGNDGGSTVTALTLDMSAAGAATFNSTLATTELNVSQSANSTRSYKLLQGYGYTTGGNYYGQYAIGTTYNSAANTGTLEFFTGSGSSAPTNRLTIDSSGNTVFNETGVDADFRVESDTNTHALFVDAGLSHVGINRAANSVVALSINSTATNSSTYALEASNSSSATKFHVRSDGHSAFYKTGNAFGFVHNTDGGITTTPDAGGHAVFNESGVDADFRVESDNDTHALFVQGSDGNVGIGVSVTKTSALSLTQNPMRLPLMARQGKSGLGVEAASDSVMAPSKVTQVPLVADTPL
jgi:fibronectin-binding autotransporter adhesin